MTLRESVLVFCDNLQRFEVQVWAPTDEEFKFRWGAQLYGWTLADLWKKVLEISSPTGSRT